jgi:hypothetical protein
VWRRSVGGGGGGGGAESEEERERESTWEGWGVEDLFRLNRHDRGTRSYQRVGERGEVDVDVFYLFLQKQN